jgi:hypothetical protein
MVMRKNFSLTKRVPFLRKFLYYIVPKLLNFSDFPVQRALINLIIEERNLQYDYQNDRKYFDDFSLKLIDLITENSNLNIELIRVGPQQDGGYFLPSHFSHSCDWITVGLGENIEFENEIVSRDCKVFSFDHTVTGKPTSLNSKVKFYPFGWGNCNNDTRLITLESMIRLSCLDLSGVSEWCLK